MNNNRIKIAILDMNDGEPNQGLRCINEIVKNYGEIVEWKIFDVRKTDALPDMTYDIFISSGGPGSPMVQGSWRAPYLKLVDDVWNFNKNSDGEKKYMFFICYSFQLVCAHFKLAEVTKRHSTSFGILPVHKTKDGFNDPILEPLSNPYYVVDSRDWQVIQPKLRVFKEHGSKILSLEKIRTHVEYERAIMAVRFSDEFVGTQYHPEADPIGMKAHFSKPELKVKIVDKISEAKYNTMMEYIEDPEKIEKTHNTILPIFINTAIENILETQLQLS